MLVFKKKKNPEARFFLFLEMDEFSDVFVFFWFLEMAELSGVFVFSMQEIEIFNDILWCTSSI